MWKVGRRAPDRRNSLYEGPEVGGGRGVGGELEDSRN